MNNGLSIRPSTPNTVLYDEESLKTTSINDDLERKNEIWTIESEQLSVEPKDENEDEENQDYEDESISDTKILFDKEFDDYYEDRVHKSGSSVIFVSKTLGLLPVIWTDEDIDQECKTYFNIYTFIVFKSWIALCIVTGIKYCSIDHWPGNEIGALYKNQTLDPAGGAKLISGTLTKTYIAANWISVIFTLLFGIFNSRTLAEILFVLAGVDSKVDMNDKQYSKINKKVILWCVFYVCIWLLQSLTMYFLFLHSGIWHLLFFVADVCTYGVPIALDLQLIFLSISARKRYRILSKRLDQVSSPWKIFGKAKENNAFQNILQYKFDQIFEPDGEEVQKMDVGKRSVPIDILFRGETDTNPPYKIIDGLETKATREEEQAFAVQLDWFRNLYTELSGIIREINSMLGFPLFTHIISLFVSFVIWLYLLVFSLQFYSLYWGYIVLMLIAASRLYLISWHAQNLMSEAKRPFEIVCRIISADGSPRLERLIIKATTQMSQHQPKLSAGALGALGYKTFFTLMGVGALISCFMVRMSEFQIFFENLNVNILEMLSDLKKKQSGPSSISVKDKNQ